MVDSAQLKELRRLTNASLSDCKRALDESKNDLFAAAVSMLTENDVHALKSSMMVRSSAGESIKDPVTESERELIGALESHFIAQRTCPVNVGFLLKLRRCFWLIHNSVAQSSIVLLKHFAPFGVRCPPTALMDHRHRRKLSKRRKLYAPLLQCRSLSLNGNATLSC